MEWKINLPLEGRWLPVATALRFDRVGRREPPPTTKRNVYHICRGGRPRPPTVDLLNQMYTTFVGAGVPDRP